MGDWGQLVQSVVLGLIISYLLAKLISIVVTFKEDNLSLTRYPEPKPEVVDSPPLDSYTGGFLCGEADSLVTEKGSSRGDTVACDPDEDDDWEGVESTELDKAFSAATALVATATADRLLHKVPTNVQMQLYGLYKIAKEGPCTSPQPSALKMTARAQWQAWQKLGAMPPEEAMEKYIEIVTQLYPTWLDGGMKSGSRVGDDAASNSRGTMGPDSLVYEEKSGNEFEAMAEFLVKHKANIAIKDENGNSPLDLCESGWPWIRESAK